MTARTALAWLTWTTTLALAGCASGEPILEGSDVLFVGRAATLTFRDVGDRATPDTPVGLGEGVEILARRAPAADRLELDVQVDPRAVLGPRDVIVAGQILRDAVTIRSPLELSVQTLPRGYVGPVRFTLEGPSTPLAGELTFYASEGITLRALERRGAVLDALIAVDPSAPLGPADLDIQLVRDGETTRFVRLAALTITEAGQAERLPPGPRDAPPGATSVRWLVPTGDASYFELDTARSPVWIWAADAEGRFALARPGASVRLLAEEPRAVAFFTTEPGASVDIAEWPVSVTRGSASTSLGEAPTLGTVGAAIRAQRLASGPLFVAIDLVDGAVGKRLYVATTGAAGVDTRLALIADDGQTRVGPASADDEWLDVLTSPVLTTGGRYFVRIEAGSRFDPARDLFDLTVVLR